MIAGDIPAGFCQCGCGGRTAISKGNSAKYGWVAGRPFRFLQGHGQRTVKPKPYVLRGYTVVRQGEMVNGRRRVRPVHVLKVEAILGKPLPRGAQVHHINGDRSDNRNCNLLVCQDAAYHNLLHRRQEALSACGNPSWRRCYVCGGYGDPAKMYVSRSTIQHRECKKMESLKWTERRRANAHQR